MIIIGSPVDVKGESAEEAETAPIRPETNFCPNYGSCLQEVNRQPYGLTSGRRTEIMRACTDSSRDLSGYCSLTINPDDR